MKTCINRSTDEPLRELYDFYYYPNPAKEERRRELLAEIPTNARDEDNYGRTLLHVAAELADCEAIASLFDRRAKVNVRVRCSTVWNA